MYYCYFKSNKLLKYLPIAILFALFFSFNSLKAQEEVLLMEGFDDGVLPAGWSQEYVTGTLDWTFPAAGDGTPSTVHSGTNKARFYSENDGYTTKLITSAISFGAYTYNPTLNFWHTQADWYGDQDELRIYYRLSDVSEWQLLVEYTDDIPVWTEETIILPEVSNTFYLAFEGEGNYGYGVQLDDIAVTAYEPIEMEYVSSTTTAFIEVTEHGAVNQQIIGIEIVTNGPVNPLALTNLALSTAGTTNPTDISNAKVFYTGTNNVFATDVQFGETFNNPSGAFNIAGNLALASGTNYFWLTYDIAPDATVGNTVNAQCLFVQVGAVDYVPDITAPGPGRIIEGAGPEPTIVTEDFTSETFPPVGWTAVVGNGTYNWTRVTSGTNPSCTNHSEPAMARYNSYNASSGHYATLFSPVLDLSNRGNEDCPVSFWMYRNSNSYTDKVEIYANTTASLIGATLLGTVNLSISQPPSESIAGWYQYTFNIPAEFNASAVVMFNAVSNYGYAIHLDDISIATFPSPMEYVSSTTTQMTGPLSRGVVNQGIIGIEVVTNGVLEPLNITNFNFTTNGTNNLNDIQNATVWYTGISNEFATTNQFGDVFAVPTATFDISGNQVLATGTNYFWLTFDIPASATNGNWVDAGCLQVTVNGEDYVPTVTEPGEARQIQSPIVGEYTIGTGGDYPTLAAAFTDINILGLAGNTQLNIIENQALTVPFVISPWTEAGDGGYYLTIKAGAPDVVLEGTATTDAVIVLNGADRVIIDGEFNVGERNLTIRNNALSGTNAAIWLKSLGTALGCNNVTIKNTNIFGANAPQSVTTTMGIYAGGTTVSTSGTGADNDNLTIQNNSVKRAYYGIFVRGSSATVLNDNLLITQNIIGSDINSEYVYYRGIDITYSEAPILSQNHIFNLRLTSGSNVSAIDIGTNCANAKIESNLIHGIMQSSTSGYGAYGININSATGNTNILIANNSIYDITTLNYSASHLTWNPFGIRISGGTGHKIYNNSVNLYGTQPASGSNGTFSAALLVSSSAVTGLDIRNNVFSNSLVGLAGSNSLAICIIGTSASFANIDNNDYFASGPYGVLGNIGGTSFVVGNNKTTLAAWQTATTKDFASKAEDPLYTANDDLLPTSIASPLVLSGVPLPEVTVDILGNERGEMPTIGAYEVEVTGLLPPILVAPLNNSIAVPNQPEFLWQPVNLAESYGIQVATDVDFINIVLEQWGIIGTSFIPDLPLPETTLLFWRATGESSTLDGNWSQVWSFITQGTLTAPALVSPLDLSTNLPNDIDFVWESVFGANQYTLQVSPFADFSEIQYEFTGLTVTNQVINDMMMAMPYFWRVNATNGVDVSEWSNVWSLSTGTFTALGTGTSYNSTTTYPAPYGNYWKGAYHQILYTADELTSAGLSAGPVYGLGFNVANVNNCGPLVNYTIKIKHTTANELTAFDFEGWTTVFTAAAYQPFNGWNMHNFDAPFIWDGVSNIIIDVCFNNYPNDYSRNASTYYTSTTFTSVIYNRDDNNANVCTVPNSSNTYTSTYRPNTRFIIDPGVSLITPEDGAIAVQVPVNIGVTNIGFELFYEYQFSSTEENFEANIVYEETTIENTLELNLDYSTTYYWRARALTGLGYTEWSAIWEFETEKVFFVGDGINSNAQNEYPAPYGNRYMGAKHQILYRAADFIAAGFMPGEIRGLAFDVAATNSCAVLNNFYIKMKAVTQNALTTFDNTGTGWVDVIAPTDYTPVDGWNMHRFDTPFIWDGVSNVLVQTCFYTPAVSFNASTRFTQTTYNSVAIKYQNGNPNICEATSPNTVSMYRPNIAFIGFEQLPAPTLIAPADLATNVPVIPTFSWNPVGQADQIQYDILIADNPDFTDPVLFVDDIQQTSYQMPFALNYNTTYYWKVIAESLGEEFISDWSEIWSFTTQIASPVLALPVNNAAGISLYPTLSWLETNGAASYQLQVSLTNTFATTIVNEVGIIGLEYLLPVELTLNTKYFWRVRATDLLGNPTNWSDIWNFTTILVTPTLATPIDGTTSEPINTTLTWNTSLGANQYQVQVSNDDFLTTVFDLNTANLSVNVLLENNTWYMWRVRSRNTANGNVSEWTEAWSFLTQIDVPVLVSPANGAIGVNYPIASLSWDLVPNGTRYNLVLASDASFENILVDMDYYINSAEVDILEPYTEYFWKVRAFDDDNNNFGEWSETFSFTTIFGPVTLLSPENNAIRQILNPELSWEAIEGVTYQLQVSPYSHFGITVINESGLTDNNYIISNPLSNNQNYFWKVRGMQGEFVGAWSEVFKFKTLPIDETPWVVTETDNSSTVIIPNNVVSLIAGRAIATGDAIGLFYNDNGTLNCAGYGVWDGFELPITVYGDDLATPIKDGYSVGETYLFKVWDNTAKDFYFAEATFTSGPDNYQIDAVSVVASLNVINTVSQSIELDNGWNMISSYVNPTAPNMVNVFAPVVSSVKIVKNGAGQQYIPQWNINTINNWNIRHGYLVFMLAPETLQIEGSKVQPTSTSIFLQQGWRLTSYLRDNPIEPQTGFATILDKLVLAKNGTGGIYVPQFNINTIGNLVPGSGYNLYLSANDELIYPSNVIQSKAGINDITPSPRNLVPSISNTGNDATLILELSNNFNGQEIGVWNSKGELVGSAVVNNGSAAINIWGNNEATEQNEGAYEGEFLTVKSYNTENNQYTDLNLYQINEVVTGNSSDFVTYSQNAIYFAKAIATSDAVAGEMTIKNQPNPCSSNTTIEFSLPNEGFVEIGLYSLNGQKVAHITNANFKAGIHTLNFDASNLTSGTYNLILRSGSQQVNQIMLIVK